MSASVMSLQQISRPFSCSISRNWLFRIHRRHFQTSRCLRQEADREKIGEFHAYKPSDYSSYDTFRKGNSEAWKYQPLVVGISAASFMIYFFYLREENYIDKHLGRSLYHSIPALEESTLMAEINENKRRGLDTTDLEKRLEKVRDSR